MHGTNEAETRKPKLEEARRRWGTAEVLAGDPRPFTPAPAMVAVVFIEEQSRRAA